MKILRAKAGPFKERPYYEADELDRLCSQELRQVNLFPTRPEAVRVERFIEKRFGVTPAYEELPDGVLGVTKFGPSGVEAVLISRRLVDEGGRASGRRVTTTLAHEAGHGLLHSHLFALESDSLSLFVNDPDVDGSRILCRNEAMPSTVVTEPKRYDGRWWEHQANRAMESLLLPKKLVAESLEALFAAQGSLGPPRLPSSRREEANQILADTFDVNPIVARIRLDHLYPAAENDQLTL